MVIMYSHTNGLLGYILTHLGLNLYLEDVDTIIDPLNFEL